MFCNRLNGKCQLIILMILLAVAGCSPKPSTKHFVLPVGFSGVFKIEKVHGHKGSYQTDSSSDTLTVPANGVLLVAPDVFEAFRPCDATKSTCNVIKAAFADGQAIILYSPLASPFDFASDTQMLLCLFGGKDAVWYAVGTHKQLSGFLEQARGEKYQKLERFLPPNKPFQQFR